MEVRRKKKKLKFKPTGCDLPVPSDIQYLPQANIIYYTYNLQTLW